MTEEAAVPIVPVPDIVRTGVDVYVTVEVPVVVISPPLISVFAPTLNTAPPSTMASPAIVEVAVSVWNVASLSTCTSPAAPAGICAGLLRHRHYPILAGDVGEALVIHQIVELQLDHHYTTINHFLHHKLLDTFHHKQ